MTRMVREEGSWDVDISHDDLVHGIIARLTSILTKIPEEHRHYAFVECYYNPILRFRVMYERPETGSEKACREEEERLNLEDERLTYERLKRKFDLEPR